MKSSWHLSGAPSGPRRLQRKHRLPKRRSKNRSTTSPKSRKTEPTSETIPKRIFGTCWKAGTGTNQIVNRRVPDQQMTHSHPCRVRAADDLEGVVTIADRVVNELATRAVIVVQTVHHARVNPKPLHLRLRKAKPARADRHGVKNVRDAPSPPTGTGSDPNARQRNHDQRGLSRANVARHDRQTAPHPPDLTMNSPRVWMNPLSHGSNRFQSAVGRQRHHVESRSHQRAKCSTNSMGICSRMQKSTKHQLMPSLQKARKQTANPLLANPAVAAADDDVVVARDAMKLFVTRTASRALRTRTNRQKVSMMNLYRN